MPQLAQSKIRQHNKLIDSSKLLKYCLSANFNETKMAIVLSVLPLPNEQRTLTTGHVTVVLRRHWTPADNRLTLAATGKAAKLVMQREN